MTTLQSVWQVLTAPYITSETETQREYMTRVVMGMILVLVLAASIPVIVGWSLVTFDPMTTGIILVLDLTVITLWMLSYRGYWRLSSYFPPFLFFMLGAHGTYQNGMLTGTLLFYVIAILLAFMLHGDRAQWLTLILATLTFLSIGWWHDSGLTSVERMTISISVVASFGGVALLSWFSTRELHRSLRQIRAYATELQHVRDHLLVVNNSLQNEIYERRRAAEALLMSQQHYQLLFQTMMNGFALLDVRKNGAGQKTEYLVREVNPAFERITGLSGTEIIGKPIHTLIPELDPGWIEFSAQAANRDIPLELSICIKRLEKHFEIYAYFPEPDQLALLFLDITERIQRQGEMEAILNVATTLRSANTPDDMLPLVLSLFTELFQADSVAIGMREANTSEIIFKSSDDIAASVLDLSLTSGGKISQVVLKNSIPYISNDLAGDPKIIPPDPCMGGLGMAALPLIARDEPLGILIVVRKKDFSDADIRLMLALTDMIANALQRASLNEETHRRLQQLDTLHNIEIALTSHTEINLAMEMVIEQILSRLDIDAADILLYESGIKTLTYVTGAGFRENSLYHTALRIGKGFASQVALGERIVKIPQLEQHDCDENTRKWVKQEGFVTYTGIPLIAKGQVNGVLELYNRSPLKQSEDWIAYLDTLARQIAIAIDNALLLQDLQKSNLELRLAYDTTLEGWAKALELRDEETEGHSKNVTHLTLELAKRLHIPEEKWINLRRGALLHDIGKMGIPDHILFKPGPLNDEEWKIMRLHPIYAYELLSPINFLRPALEIPYCHHERWDGSGYPRHLKGEEIPLAARIFAVVDVWDALRSNRPYRAAWPEQTVRNYLKEQAGIQFDPRIVEEFLKLLDEIKSSI